MNIAIDARELTAFGNDLKRAAKVAAAGVKPIINKGAVNIKKQMRKEAFASEHFGPMGGTINFDLFVSPDAVWAEIGPDEDVHYGKGPKGTPGHLAAMAYFGGLKGGGGGTVKDPKEALEAEAPNVEKHLTDLIEKALR